MATDNFSAEVHLRVIDDLSVALDKDAAKIQALNAKLADLATKENALEPKGGFRGLVMALKNSGFEAELDEIERKVKEFKELVNGIGGLTAKIAEDSASLMHPLTTALDQAKEAVGHLKGAVTETPGAVEHAGAGAAAGVKPPAPVDQIGASLAQAQARASTIETLAKPAVALGKEASSFQDVLLSIASRYPFSPNDMSAIRQATLLATQNTQLAPLDEAKIVEILVQHGFTPAEVAKLLPVVSTFADTQKLLKKTPYEKSVEALFAAGVDGHKSSADELEKFADLFNSASLLVDVDTKTLADQVRATEPTAKGELGMSDRDVMLANILASRLGFSDGKDLVKALEEAIPGVTGTGKPDDKTQAALREMGMADDQGKSTLLKAGHFDFPTFLEMLAKFENKVFADKSPGEARPQIASTLQHAFGTASRLIAGLSQDGTIDATREMGQRLDQVHMRQIEANFDAGSTQRQLDKAAANLQIGFIELGQSILPGVNEALKTFNFYIGAFNGWAAQHPEAGKWLGWGTAGLATFLGLGVVGNFVKSAGSTAFKMTGLPWLWDKLARAAPAEEAAAADVSAARAAAEALFEGGPLAADVGADVGAGMLGTVGGVVAALGIGGWFSEKWQYEQMNKLVKPYDGEDESARQLRIQSYMTGGSEPLQWSDLGMKNPYADGKMPDDTVGRWIASLFGWKSRAPIGNAEAAPAKPSPPVPAWPAISITPDNFVPGSFTPPSDRRGPTVERAAALSNADAPAKPQPVNVQIQPGQVVVQLDGHAIATAVMEFIARQVGGPNTGPAAHDPFQAYTPAGGLIYGMAT